MKQLLTIVVPRIAMEWEVVAYALRFSISKVVLIKKNAEMILRNVVIMY